MAKSKNTSLKTKLQKAKARLLSSYYSNPAKDLKIFTVTGTTGRDTTAHYLQEILKSRDPKTGLIIDPASTSALYKKLYKIWKTGTDHVVLSVSSSALANHICYGLPIFCAILTDDISEQATSIVSPTPQNSDAKAILFNTQPFFSVLNYDDKNYELYAKYPSKTATLSFGHARSADLRINRSKLYKKGTEANFTFSNDTFDVATYITGEECVPYMAAAATAALAAEFPPDAIIDGIANYEPKSKN